MPLVLEMVNPARPPERGGGPEQFQLHNLQLIANVIKSGDATELGFGVRETSRDSDTTQVLRLEVRH